MPDIKLTLEVLSNTEYQDWRVDRAVAGGFKYRFDIDDSWLSISKDELDEIDVRLTPVLTKLAAVDSGDIDGRYVCQTARLWLSKPVFLEPEADFSPQYIIAVEEVYPIQDDTISFAAIVGETDIIDDIIYVKAVQRFMLFEPIEWFERNYPGGCGRLVAGLGLDLSEKELVAYVFDSTARVIKSEDIALPNQNLV